MEQISNGSVCDQFPPLSAKYPWLIAQNLKDEEHDTQDQFFHTICDEFPHYRCRIPKLYGKRIQGFFHGWVILSNHPYNNKWSLWNQVTSKIISLPTLILKDGEYESIGQCCLSAPPNDPNSILLLTRTDKSTLVFCRLDSKRKKFGWTEMSYAYQLKRLTCDCKLIYSPTCCSGKVYALSTDGYFCEYVIHVDIVVKYKEVVIKLMLFGSCPKPSSGRVDVDVIYYLKGSSTELYYIEIFYEKETRNIQKKPNDVYLFKVDMTSINWEERECLKNWDIADTGFSGFDDLTDSDTISEISEEFDFTVLNMSREIWEEIDDLKDSIIFIDLARDHSVSYNRVIASELGGFIHIRGEMGDIIYSYHVKTDAISLFPIPSMLPTSHVLMWECRLDGDHGEAKCIVDSKVEMENNDEILLRSGTDDGVKFNESHLLNIPFNLLEVIMELCVGVEYMNFRATCKQCLLAAPLIKWSNETSLRRLQTYSLVSPWLMLVDKTRNIIIFTDPMAGDNYFLKNSEVLFDVNHRKWCSRFGWLLFKKIYWHSLIFFNPFTNDLRELPEAEHCFDSFCFSAPPTSLDCMVVGFTKSCVYIHFVNQEPTWRTLRLDTHPHNVCSSTLYGRDLYALCEQGEVIAINNLGKEDHTWKVVKTEAPKGHCRSSTQYFLGNFDQHSLLVRVGAYGEAVEVFKRNESKQEWERIYSLGRHAIYICSTTCLYIEAKVPKMENKIFFPRLHTKNKKVVFYSLDTCMYHTFDGESVQGHLRDFIGTTYHLSLNTWIEPTWS